MTASGVDAIDAIACACFRSFAALPNARLLDDGRVFGVVTDVPIGFFSGIARSQLDAGDVGRVVAEFGARPFRWWISPSAQPAKLADELLSNGMRPLFTSTGMTADLASLATVDAPVRIEQVSAEQYWIDVFLEGFRKPREERDTWLDAYNALRESWVHFVGYVDRVPVATTSLLLAGDLAGVYHVVTLPPYRGRGIGAAMTLEAMRVGHDFGAKTAVLQASPMGLRVYQSVGFEAVCELRAYTT